ncbi:MAG: CopD family protein [Gammaproteobacteria bacterium]|nr:CopD family protein [Gammaproteobacteria bacterium]
MPLILVIHVLAAVIWVGGMFFAHQILRPAVQALDPAVRLPLWSRTFARFFPWVWSAVILLPATGYFMMGRWFGFAHAPLFVNLMQGIGIVMILIYLHVFFAPYAQLRRALAAQDLPAAGRAISQIRVLVGTNTLLGLLTIAIAVGGSR